MSAIRPPTVRAPRIRPNVRTSVSTVKPALADLDAPRAAMVVGPVLGVVAPDPRPVRVRRPGLIAGFANELRGAPAGDHDDGRVAVVAHAGDPPEGHAGGAVGDPAEHAAYALTVRVAQDFSFGLVADCDLLCHAHQQCTRRANRTLPNPPQLRGARNTRSVTA